MLEQVVFLGKENFYIEEFGVERHLKENTSDYNPFLNNGFVKDLNSFYSNVNSILNLRNKSKNFTILIPDIMFISKVLYFDKLPISLKKKNELIFWKFENFLPAKQSLYDIKYNIFEKNVLTFALPKNFNNILNDAVMKNFKQNYNILPEFLYILNKINKSNYINCILIINRKNYFTAAYLKNGMPLFIRTREKTNSIKMEEEIDLIKKIINEKWNEQKEIVVFGENIDSYKCIKQEWL